MAYSHPFIFIFWRLIMHRSFIDNPNTINIFTDASLVRRGAEGWDACYGAEVVLNDEIIDERYRIISDTTVNNAEIKGIRAGVDLAIKYRSIYPDKKFNLFSDSQVSVLGIRNRILSWNIADNQLINKQKDCVANQDVYLDILYIILRFQLNIRIYHQKGHVDIGNINSVVNACNVFRASNMIKEKIDLELIRYISKYNNNVDNATRLNLISYNRNVYYQDAVCSFAVEYDKNNYRKLTSLK